MSFENDMTEIKKLRLKEFFKAGTETETPVITPEAPTEKPTKPSTPIRPAPGVTPKPKALVDNDDVELFLKRRGLDGGANELS